MWIAIVLVSVLLALLVAWVLPVAAARLLMPSIAAGSVKTVNYRGHRVPLGLGLVWAAWAIGVAALATLWPFAVRTLFGDFLVSVPTAVGWRVALGLAPVQTAAATVPALLVVGAVALGLADDVFGVAGAKGFRGHLEALRSGRLTTGMVKVLGIGTLAALTAAEIASSITRVDAQVATTKGVVLGLLVLVAWVAATLVIALSANLVNLTDLRPGRALKSYVGLAVVGGGLSVWGFWSLLERRVGTAGTAGVGVPAGPDVWIWLAGCIVCLLAVIFGPVFAVWRHDLGERAMLGDAGANAMGAFAGYLLARNAPLWLLVVFAVVLLVLNLASERVSFTAVIEQVPILKRIDGLGRLAAEDSQKESNHGGDDGARTGGSAPEGDDARRDDVN